MYRRVMKERDFLEKVSYVGIFTGVSKRELCALQTICISDQGNTQIAESFAERKRPDGISLHPRTIFAYLCASVTRSISNMTSSSTVGYSGSFFLISCSIRWYNSTSYLQKNKKGFLCLPSEVVSRVLTVTSLSVRRWLWHHCVAYTGNKLTLQLIWENRRHSNVKQKEVWYTL